jgi:t-SNARE complex subunit (syntaxin)
VGIILDIKDLCIAAINAKTLSGNDEVRKKIILDAINIVIVIVVVVVLVNVT